MEKRWKLLSSDSNKSELLSKSLNINQNICKILVQRGLENFEENKKFFRPQLSDLYSPWLMKDMEKAVQRILNSFESQEKLLVFGDYDVDGTTSVASFFQFIQSIYSNVEFYIPHRYKEGYGVSKAGIDYAKEKNITLIISLDCGIKSYDLISYAKDLGIDFIVCDHHMPDDQIPPATAILNPKQVDCNYPFKELCGCGVGFKLMQAISEKLNLGESSYLAYLDLVALAIAADIVPIIDENRILAYYGLQKVNQNPNEGIKALLNLAASPKNISINNLVFIIAPRINAAGRMDDAKKAVELFIEKDYNKALKIAELLQSDNIDRKEADKNITEEALRLINENEHLIHKKTTVLYQEHWHKGVVGIVASRIIETYFRPTIILTKSGDVIAGSARSVPGFNLYESIHACNEHLLGYGGHFAAAGLTLLPDNLENFIEKFEEVVSNTIEPQMLIPEIIIDVEINFNEITHSFYNIISQMEPYGPENMRPVFISKNVTDFGYSKIVKEAHIKFVLKQNNSVVNGIGFNLANKFPSIESKQPLDIVYTLDLNEYNGNSSIQIKVIDFKLSA